MNSESLNGKNLILWKANQISLHFLLIFVKTFSTFAIGQETSIWYSLNKSFPRNPVAAWHFLVC